MDYILLAFSPVLGAMIGGAAAYVFNLKKRIDTLEREVDYLFSDDPEDDDPDEHDVASIPQKVVAFAGKLR